MIKWIIHLLSRFVAPHLVSPVDHENIQADYLRIMRELATAEQTARQRESHVEDLRRANEALRRDVENLNREIVRREQRSRAEYLMRMDVPPIPRSGVGVAYSRMLGESTAVVRAQRNADARLAIEAEQARRAQELQRTRLQRAMGLPIEDYRGLRSQHRGLRSQQRDQQRFTGPEPEDL